MRERWFARRRMFGLSMGERDDGIINDAITNEEVSITTIEGSCVSVAIVDNFTETLRKTEQKIIALAKSFSAAS